MTLAQRLMRMAPMLVAAVLSGVVGCSWRDDLDGERRVPEGASTATPSGSVPAAQLVRESAALAIDLFASRPLLSGHRRGALVIEAGTPDFVKYIDGGVRGDWLRGITVPGPDPTGGVQAVAAVHGLAAELYFPLDDDPGGIERSDGGLSIRFTAKSAVKNQLVSVFLNEHKITDLRMPTTDWQTYSLKASEESVVLGENKLRFYFRSAGEVDGASSAAAFGRFVIGASLGDEAAFAVASEPGQPQDGRGLIVDAASRLSYYLQLPDVACALHVAVHAEDGASIRIHGSARPDSEQLWAGTSSEVAIDLQSYRGQIVRLDLLSDGAASWKMPRVVYAEDQGPVALPVLPKADRILFWSVSSLRSDRLAARAGQGFQRFVDHALVVRRMQAAVPAAGGANASMMLGRFRTSGFLEEARETLAEKLQEQGFATALISGNGFVNDAAGFSQGFGFYDNPMRRQHHFGAKTLWRQAKKFLMAHKGERSFVHVATVEGHVPYRPSDEALSKTWQLAQPFSPAKTLDLAVQIDSGRRQVSENDKAYVRALYDASILDAGGAFAAMLEELAAMHLPGNTVVILAGEHGEEMWERGRFGHGSSLFQESLLTPLAIQGEGLSKLVPPGLASTLDVAPTVLHLAGIAPGPSMQGRSVLATAASSLPRPLFSGLSDGSRALRLGRYKVIISARGQLSLYDLEHDAGERDNVAETEPIAGRALRITLATFTAFEDEWSTARWGQPSSPLEAFARDLGF